MTDTRFQSDEWKIIETRFEPGRGRDSESIFALGNGMMGQRANFEETYTGDTLRGSYVAGVYYPDKTVHLLFSSDISSFNQCCKFLSCT